MPKQQSNFIERLYAAIQEHRSSVVDWDPSGKGFIVGNLAEFTNQVLLRKFGIGRLDSFARKLNKHGFKRSKLDKNKIRFFHKYFNRQSKNLSQIKKLTKEQSLPKHIKLKLIREELNRKNIQSRSKDLSDIVSQIYENEKVKQNQHSKSPASLVEGVQEEAQYNLKQFIEEKEDNKSQFVEILKSHGTIWKTCNSIHEKSSEKPKIEMISVQNQNERFQTLTQQNNYKKRTVSASLFQRI